MLLKFPYCFTVTFLFQSLVFSFLAICVCVCVWHRFMNAAFSLTSCWLLWKAFWDVALTWRLSWWVQHWTAASCRHILLTALCSAVLAVPSLCRWGKQYGRESSMAGSYVPLLSVPHSGRNKMCIYHAVLPGNPSGLMSVVAGWVEILLERQFRLDVMVMTGWL